MVQTKYKLIPVSILTFVHVLNTRDVQDGSGDETEDMAEEEEEEGKSSENDVTDSSSINLERKRNKSIASINEDYNIYSSGTRNIKEDIKKGIAIRNQLGINCFIYKIRYFVIFEY